jgi:hypothetical protein
VVAEKAQAGANRGVVGLPCPHARHLSLADGELTVYIGTVNGSVVDYLPQTARAARLA